MRTSFLPERLRTEFGRRAMGIAVALAIEVLLLLALLSLSYSIKPEPKAQLTVVDLKAQDMSEEEPEKPTPEKSTPPPTAQTTPQPADTPAPVPMPTPAAVIPLPKAPQAPPPPAAAPRPAPPAVVMGPAQGPADTGSHYADDAVRVGTAPNGEPMYAARWYREPGQEFWGYLSAASPGSALMACRTIADFEVADCVPLGETAGSQLSRSILAGAGVLRVRPPRLGGRSLVGSWVRIRIDYTVTRVPAGPGAARP